MRKYALVILSNTDSILDRFNLDIVQNPTGNGFELDLSKLSGDIEDIITKVTQKKPTIKFNVIQRYYAYQKAATLASWIQKYSTTDYRMALEYDDGNITRYSEGKVTSLSKGEIDEYKILTQAMVFTCITPYFQRITNTITIQKASTGKTYPYKYPYQYGASVIENNEINNPYLLDIPLILTIDGAITNPTIDLLDEYGVRYQRIQFYDFELRQGEQLIINSAQRKIYKIDELGVETDFVTEVNPNFDTFLRAENGISKINVNTSDAGDGFKLIGGWRQYML